ncbi:MAG: IPT/TIG domain-containing protein, partial [Solirubrobacteraceae bacterium]
MDQTGRSARRGGQVRDAGGPPRQGRRGRRRLWLLSATALGVFVIAPVGAPSARVAGRQAVPLAGSGAPVVLLLTPAQGPSAGGTKVEILGEDLKGATTVYFGDAAVQLKKPGKSASKVGVVSPPGVGTVDVTVATPEATSEITTADRFTYEPSPPVVSGLSPKSAPADSRHSVTVSGQNFAGATEVRFGAISVPFTVVKSTKLKASAPVGRVLGPVDVTVTTPEGTSEASPADQFTFTPESPVAAYTVPEIGPGAGGNTVTVIGEGLLDATQVEFDGVPAESFEVIDDAELLAVPPPHTTERIAVTVTTPSGKSASYCYGPLCAPVAHYKYKTTFTSISPGSGPREGGTPITVTGSGFSTKPGGTTILIGDHEATLVECSSISTCTALTPEGKQSAGREPVEVRV